MLKVRYLLSLVLGDEVAHSSVLGSPNDGVAGLGLDAGLATRCSRGSLSPAGSLGINSS